MAQTVLSEGDIAVIGINTGGSGNDAMKLLTFVDLECATTFVVTDDNWNSSTPGWPCSSGNSEFGIRVTVTSRVLSGSVFYIEVESAADIPNSTVSTGSATFTGLGGAWGANYGLNSGGDDIHILQGNPDERTSPKFIFSLKHGSSFANNNTCTGGGAVNNTGLPSNLTLGTNALVIASGQDQWHYSCLNSPTSGTHAAVLSAICNSSNWTTTAAELVWNNSTCFFNITDEYPIDGILAVSGAGCGCLAGCDLTSMGGPNCGAGVGTDCSAGRIDVSLDISVPATCTYTVLASMRAWDNCSGSASDNPSGSASDDRLKVDLSGGGKAYQTGIAGTLNDSYTLTGPGTITISGSTNRADEIIAYRILANESSDNCATCAVILPVSLAEFRAAPEARSVVLDWETLSEYNADYFQVERSPNGYDWEFVTTIKAIGYSNSKVQYRIYDGSPLSNTSFYRLREYDFDGSQLFSSVRSVVFTGDAHLVTTINLLGQEVNDSYRGVIIEIYSDGSKVKKLQ